VEPGGVGVELATDGRDLRPLGIGGELRQRVERRAEMLRLLRPLARVLRLLLGVAGVQEEVLLEPAQLERRPAGVVRSDGALSLCRP